MSEETTIDHPVEARRAALSNASRQLLGAARTLLGDSALYRQAETLTQEYHGTLERLANQRGLHLLTIAFVGPLNAGKTFLARLLVRQEAALEQMPSGESTDQRTQRLTWIGPEKPPALDPAMERHVAVPQDAMESLGQSYLLLDTPGAGDRDSGLSALSRRALTSARLKVLVLPGHQRRAEIWKQYLNEGDGSLVLPVIRLSAAESRDLAKNEPEVRSDWQRHLIGMREMLKRSTILEPVLLPDVEVAESAAEGEQEVRNRLVHALREAVQSEAMRALSPIPQMLACDERYRTALSALLSAKLEALHAPHEKLRAATNELPERAVDFLMRDRRRLRAMLRSELRQDLMERISPLAFPFRTMAGLLCTTTGAWDRVILAGTGSLPSLLMSGVSAVRNLREQADATRELRNELEQRLDTLVRNTVGPAFKEFQHAVSTVTDEPANAEPLEFAVHGADAFREHWEREKEATIQRHRAGGLGLGFFGLLGMTAFWFLLGAPLLHLYGQYIAAAWHSWQGDWSSAALTAYPALGAGFWLTALALASIPAFILALILVALALSRRRVEACEGQLREAMQTAVQQGEMPFAIEVTAPLLKAADHLMRLRD